MKINPVTEQSIEKLLNNSGIERDEFDVHAYWDSSLSDQENIGEIKKILKEQVGVNGDFKYESEDSKGIKAELTAEQRMMDEKLEASLLKSALENQPELVVDANEIIDEVKGFSYGTDSMVWLTIFSLMRRGKLNCLNIGQAGHSKSRSTTEVIRLLDLPKTHILAGKYTAKRFYTELCEHKEDDIAIDESSALLRNEDIVDMLKDALTHGTIGWKSSRDEKEDEFDFKASIIFNANMIEHTDDSYALMDRCMTTNMKLTADDFIAKRKQSLTYEVNKSVWGKIRNRLVVIRKGKTNIKLTAEEIAYIDNYVEGEVRRIAVGFSPYLSFRIWKRAEEIFLRMKLLFGGHTVETIEMCKDICSHVLIPDNPKNVVVKILSSYKDKDISKGIIIEEIQNAKQISQRQARRIFRKLADEGSITELNKFRVRIE